MDIKILIGLRIKELRRSAGMSQEMLAEQMGISPKYLSSIERGKENPTLDTFIKLSNALNIDISELFNCSHEGKSAKSLREFITSIIKNSDEEKLRLTVKMIKAIHL